MASIKMYWEAPGGKKSPDKLSKNLRELDQNIQRVITGEFLYHKDEATKYMKLNAPWTDRTGAARSGLHSIVPRPTRDHWELIVAHSVYYGIYLEVCNSGKYQIIMPTVNHIGALLLKRMENALDRIGASR